MNNAPIRLGPLALLMTVISICLTILSILTLTTAGADLRLAEKYADASEIRFELEEQGQELLAEVDGVLANGGNAASVSGVKEENGTYTAELDKDGYILNISFTEDNNTYNLTGWKITREWNEDNNINIWDGN